MIHTISTFQNHTGPKEDVGVQEKAVYFPVSLTQRILENSEDIDAEMVLECLVLPAKKGKTALDTSLYKRWLFLLVLQHLMEVFEMDSCRAQNQGSVSKLLSV